MSNYCYLMKTVCFQLPNYRKKLKINFGKTNIIAESTGYD